MTGRWLLALALVACCRIAPADVDAPPFEEPPGVDPEPERRVDGRALVLVSLDGFRWDYLDRHPTPNLDRIAEGVRADSLRPPFPSYTFPSHYTIVTGLHPEAHGIVSNVFYDPIFRETFKLGEPASMTVAKWWGGEPIWNTAERQGVRAATLFWPGSEAPIGDMRPSDWTPYDHTLPHRERVNRVVTWLRRPPETRPGLITLYFSSVDSAGHKHGPDSPEVANAIGDVDGAIGMLLAGIEAEGLSDLVDLVVVSDHGMAARDTERVVVLDDYDVDLSAFNAVEWSPVLAVNPHRDRHDEVLAQLKAVPRLSCHARAETPPEWHYREHRAIADILCLADNGWQIARRDYLQANPDRLMGGTHGWDPAWPEMHGIFLARGPRFQSGARLPTVDAVDLYGMMCRALAIQPAAHQGDPALAERVLRPAQ
jgi:predicted AlkP superfamily pyrophosphatase or phosphodiesterase